MELFDGKNQVPLIYTPTDPTPLTNLFLNTAISGDIGNLSSMIGMTISGVHSYSTPPSYHPISLFSDQNQIPYLYG